VAKLGINELNLLPYQNYGRYKYNLLGWDYPFKNDKILDKEDVNRLRTVVIKQGLKVKIGG
jgi:hypothetical protein